MRILPILSILPMLAGALGAQCLNTAGGVSAGLVPTYTYPAGDEGRSPPIDMLFGPAGFPMAGAVGPLTHVVVGSNGELYLTSGGAPVDPVDFGGYGVTDMRGIAGASPRVFPFSDDLEGLAGSYAVTVDTSVAGRCKVNWIDVEEYFSGGPTFSFSAALYSTGVIELTYGTLPVAAALVGVSIGNAVGTGLETSVDLTAGPNSGALGMMFQQTNGIDVPGFSERTITFIPNGTGWLAVVTCSPAENQAYGIGCYTIASPTDTFYELFPDAALASAALQGNAMVLSPLGNGYSAAWIPGGASSLYIPPTGGASSLAPSDDDDTVVALPGLLPIPGGNASTVTVSANGIVTIGGVGNNYFDYSPSGAEVASAAGQAFYTWSDFRDNNVTPAPSGTIKTELVGTLFCITWDAVDHWTSPQTTSPSTWQFQFDLATGNVFYVWVTINTDTTSTFGSSCLVGYTGPAAGTDPGSINLATAGAIVATSNVDAMTLSAAPPPVINPSTLVTYTAGNLPEFIPGSGVYLSTMFLSVNPNPFGFDLAGILTNTPGCNAWIVTLDLDLGAQLTVAPTATWNFTYDNTFFAPGNIIAAQAIALFDGSFPLGNGENGGFVFSNGVRSRTELQ